jgi:hypothetical protein
MNTNTEFEYKGRAISLKQQSLDLFKIVIDNNEVFEWGWSLWNAREKARKIIDFTEQCTSMNPPKTDMNTKQIPWRADYEPFRGRVWNYGNYQIVQESTLYVAFHGGKRIAQSIDWSEVDRHCVRHLNHPWNQ